MSDFKKISSFVEKAFNEFKEIAEDPYENSQAILLSRQLSAFFALQKDLQQNCYFADMLISDEKYSKPFYAKNDLIIEDSSVYYVVKNSVEIKTFTEKKMKIIKIKPGIPKDVHFKLVPVWYDYMRNHYYFSFEKFIRHTPKDMLLGINN